LAVILKLVTIIAALHYTVLVSYVEVTKYLINEHKYSPEHGNITPLHSAATNSHL